MQKYQAEHRRTTKVVERNRTLSVQHYTSTNARQSKEEAADTPNRQHVTHQLLTTHTSALFATWNRSMPVKAHQVNWIKPAHSRYVQARAQLVHKMQPEDQDEWLQRQLHRFPKHNLRRSDRAKHAPSRWHPSNRDSSMNTSMSSSVGNNELQLALQDPGPTKVLTKASELQLAQQDSGPTEAPAEAATKRTASTFAELQPQAGRTVMPAHLLPEEMRLKSSSEVKAEASTRVKQCKIKFSHRPNWTALKHWPSRTQRRTITAVQLWTAHHRRKRSRCS